MNYEVEVKVTESFKKSAKRLLKKSASLRAEIRGLQADLMENPEKGIPLGNDAYKIRLRIRSKGRGKSGGARVITYVETEVIGIVEEIEQGMKTVNLLFIYDKADTESISQEELASLIKNVTDDESTDD